MNEYEFTFCELKTARSLHPLTFGSLENLRREFIFNFNFRFDARVTAQYLILATRVISIFLLSLFVKNKFEMLGDCERVCVIAESKLSEPNREKWVKTKRTNVKNRLMRIQCTHTIKPHRQMNDVRVVACSFHQHTNGPPTEWFIAGRWRAAAEIYTRSRCECRLLPTQSEYMWCDAVVFVISSLCVRCHIRNALSQAFAPEVH